jgi:phasin
MATNPSKAPRAVKAAQEEAEQAFSSARDAAEANFAYASFDVPEFIRSFAEQSLSQTRSAYGRMKQAVEETADLMEASVESSREGLRDAQVRALDLAKDNTDATFELARQLLATTSVAEAFQLQAAFARDRFEAFAAYSRAMQDTLSKAGADAAKPAKTLFERSLTVAKAA